MFITVAEFQTAFGHPVATEPTLPSQEVRDLRTNLIQEELFEYCDAFDADDIIEMADALGDLLYVLAGAALTYGVAALDEPIWSPYEGMAPAENGATCFPDLLREDFAAYQRAEESGDLQQIQFAICHFMVEIYGIARQQSVPINAVFREIHRSNMSKLMPDGSVLRRADGKVMKGTLYSPPNIAKVLAEHSDG